MPRFRFVEDIGNIESLVTPKPGGCGSSGWFFASRQGNFCYCLHFSKKKITWSGPNTKNSTSSHFRRIVLAAFRSIAIVQAQIPTLAAFPFSSPFPHRSDVGTVFREHIVVNNKFGGNVLGGTWNKTVSYRVFIGILFTCAFPVSRFNLRA